MAVEKEKHGGTILIRKASGEEQPFSKEKLERSLLNAGAESDYIRKIVDDIEKWIYPGVTTKKIYSRAFSLLRRERTASSSRYRLKQAIFELGPTGYPFEVLIGELFRAKGFSCETGIIVNGRCVTHEMDVIATADGIQHLIECKFHKDQGKQVSVQVPLYVRSRVDDIVDHRSTLDEYKGYKFKAWVVTNTYFSADSIHYGLCRGLKLLAWDFPRTEGLKSMLDRYKIYPVTILHRLTVKEKQHLLDMGMVTCRQLFDNLSVLEELGLSRPKNDAIKKELGEIFY